MPARNKSRSAPKAKERAPSQLPVTMPNKRPDSMSDRQRYDAIELAAYFMSEQRGFEPGHELEDWCNAERQFDAECIAD